MKPRDWTEALNRIAAELEGRIHRRELGGTLDVKPRRGGVELAFHLAGGHVRVELDADNASTLANKLRGALRVARATKKGGRK